MLVMGKNLVFFYIYRLTSRMYFHLAVLFVYFYINDIPFLGIEFLLAVYGLVLLVSSYWTNKILRLKEKNVLILGETVKIFGLIFLLFSSSFYLLILGQVFSGVGYSLTSGTDSKLLKNLTSSNEEYNKREANSNSYMFISFLLAGIFGSLLFAWNEESIFYASMFASLVSIVSLYNINFSLEYYNYTDKKKNMTDNNLDRQSKSINFWGIYYAVSRAFPLAIFVGFLPYYLFVQAQINLYFFGAVISLFTFAGFLSAKFSIHLLKLDTKILIVINALLISVSMLALAFVSNVYISILIVIILGMSSGLVRPLTRMHVHSIKHNQESISRIFSSYESLYGIWNATLLIVGGLVYTYYNYTSIMLIFTLIYLIAMLRLFMLAFNLKSESIFTLK